MSKLKVTQSQWLHNQLVKYGYDKVKAKFELFKKKYPTSTQRSFDVSVKREARLIGNTDDESRKAKEQERKAKLELRLKKQITNQYTMFVKRAKRSPKLKELGYTGKVIKDLFGSIKDLDARARRMYPSRFKGVIDQTVWSPKRLTELKGTIKKCKRFIITTAVGGCPVDSRFLNSIKTYCKTNKAELLILVADQSLDKLDKTLIDENIVFDDVKLNSNLFISTIKILPKMIEPVTGLDRIGSKCGSFIFGSPKQRLVYVPIAKRDKVPHCLMTTGALTLPKYMGAKYYQKRTDYLAEQDHKMGAVIVDVQDDKIYHFRQVQMDNDGGFVDVGNYYGEKKVSKVSAEGIVMGDFHSGDQCKKTLNCWYNLGKDIKCDTVVVHDGFNGHSINHHSHGDSLHKARAYAAGRLGLQKELDEYVEALNELGSKFNNIVITYGNHDHFIYKYLKFGLYLEDPENHLISLDLAKQVILGNNPIEWYVSSRLKPGINIKWLRPDDDHNIEGISVGKHGHQGSNGSRGFLKGLEKTVSKAVYGHSHTPQILREVYQVGTTTKLKLDYTTGPSSWFNTSCVIYKGGHRQLINSVNGEYTVDKG